MCKASSFPAVLALTSGNCCGHGAPETEERLCSRVWGLEMALGHGGTHVGRKLRSSLSNHERAEELKVLTMGQLEL